MKALRWIAIVIVLAAIGAGLIWLAAQQGQIIYRTPAVEVETPLVAAVVALLLLCIVLTGVINLGVYLWTLPGRIKKARAEAAQKKGLDALALGFAALEVEDLPDARRQVTKAAAGLTDARLPKLLAARLASVSGDTGAAERAFGELADLPGYAAAARRGLAEAAVSRGADATALSHAETALDSAKQALWPARFLFERKVAAYDWEGALQALDVAEKRGLMGPKTAERRRAVVLSAAAATAERAGDTPKALDLARRAAKLSAGFAPGAALAARLLAKAGKSWEAASTLESAWEQAPHPALALAYRDLKADEDASAKARWLDGLAQMNPGHRESRILRAEQAILLGDGAAAISQLMAIQQDGGLTARLAGLLAAACRVQGDLVGARDWMAKAWSAAREADWSDLDPEGDAFAYEPADWARLVESYGAAGVLIHPRHERFAPERLAAPELPAEVATAAAPAETPFVAPDADFTRRPDDPGIADEPVELPADQKPRFPFLR